jgi:hypothetical protein
VAPRFPRRRDQPEEDPTSESDEDDVRLDDDEHAWWAQRDVAEVWSPRESPAPEPEPAPQQDLLAEQFGDDWRTSFTYDPPPAPHREAEPAVEPEPDTSDPYAVLEIEASATWDEIVDAHRRMARRHHPDRLVGRPDTEIAAGEDRIRVINAAYADLRIRRGR